MRIADLRQAAFGLLAACVFIAAAGTAAAQDQRTLLINLTTDDVWTNQMAFGYANAVLDAGYDVAVFLNVRSVVLANEHVPQHTEGARGQTAHEELTALIERGARIFVCRGCTRQAGLSPDDWIDGVEPSGADLIAIQMAPTTSIMSF